MNITVVGSGFVGQATGKGLAKHGNKITFLDVDRERLAGLRQDGFRALHPTEATTIDTDVTMFCVPTPTVGGQFQSEILRQAVEEFAWRLRGSSKYHVVVIRSTVPPKTTREFVLPLIEEVSGKKAGRDFGLVMQPEYLREVTAEQDFARPWFILIGELDEKSGDVVEKIYRDFDAPIQRVSLEEAEFQKYVHNVYNAFKIAFFNEMRVVANAEGWNAQSVFEATAESCEGIWNPMYGLRDFGPFDGSCLPKDTSALLEWGDMNGHQMEILRAVISENLRHASVLGRNTKVRNNVLETVHAWV
ncbi:MAG TPA: 2-dehydropantoate 2-reductase N-terminal domain-containing protein [Aeromicrobium sp.]|nr:2-dehydropantoate 2-reductase N-terminal domain-containing protein [Aeromicrobium sp.]